MNRFELGDCFELLKTVEDGSIDMAFCDLPYGCTANDWDTQLDIQMIWSELNRCCKANAAMIFTATFKFAIQLAFSNPKAFRYDLVWSKNRTSGYLNANKMPLRTHELILLFYREPPTYNPQKTKGIPYVTVRPIYETGNYGTQKASTTVNDGDRFPLSVQEFSFDRELGVTIAGGSAEFKHPTQKPQSLLTWLIKTYTNENETVLDPTAGSGSTAVAALETKRNFICFETEQRIL